MDLEQSRINVGDKIVTKNLKNADFNEKTGVVEDYIHATKRYVILFDDDRTAAIKEENLDKNIYENIENID